MDIVCIVCAEGATKLKLGAVGIDGAVDVEKLGEKCGVAQLSRRNDCADVVSKPACVALRLWSHPLYWTSNSPAPVSGNNDTLESSSGSPKSKRASLGEMVFGWASSRDCICDFMA